MLCVRLRKKSLTTKEFRLENEGFARGTSYVGIQDHTILFFFIKPTVHFLYQV